MGRMHTCTLDWRCRAIFNCAAAPQLLAVTDVDHDGKISYPEFVPLGADIIQTMRLRHLNADTIAYRNEVAEAQARESVHGLEEDEMTEHILQVVGRAYLIVNL